MFARAGIVTAIPVSSAPTEFELTDVNGAVQIVALKGDLQISDGSQTMTLRQGQQATQKIRTKLRVSRINLRRDPVRLRICTGKRMALGKW
jgi:hypothetical protein